jgi:hypothetical protein
MGKNAQTSFGYLVLLRQQSALLGPFLSPDNNYHFFSRHNGIKGDIYWVSLRTVTDLRDSIK